MKFPSLLLLINWSQTNSFPILDLSFPICALIGSREFSLRLLCTHFLSLSGLCLTPATLLPHRHLPLQRLIFSWRNLTLWMLVSLSLEQTSASYGKRSQSGFRKVVAILGWRCSWDWALDARQGCQLRPPLLWVEGHRKLFILTTLGTPRPSLACYSQSSSLVFSLCVFQVQFLKNLQITKHECERGSVLKKLVQ